MTTTTSLRGADGDASVSEDACAIAASSPRSLAAIALIASGPVALAIGFVHARMWQVLPWERLVLTLVLALTASAIAWPLRRYARLPWALALALVWLAALPLFAGPLPVLAVLLLALAALALGTWLVPAGMPARAAVALCVGLVLIAGLAGWTLSWPVHSTPAWAVVLLALVLLRRRSLVSTLGDAARRLREAVEQAPRWATFATTLFGLASTACWIPTMQVDDLAYHLGLPSHLLLYGHYRPDPAHQVWSFAPWLGDVLQAVAALLAREDARGAVNALWLALIAPLSWTASAAIGAKPAERWACAALVASFPPLVWMAAGMQTELPATVLLLAAMVVATSREPRWLLPAAVLFAGMAALKTMHSFAAAPLAVYALWHHRTRLDWKTAAAACVLALLVAASSYVQAWWHTGNPLMPLFNNLFHSPYLPDEAYRDPRWFTGFSLALPWLMSFDTPRYVEAFNGGLGFTLVALAGVWLLALARRSGRGIAIAVTLVAWLPLVPMQYVRYAYPGLILLSALLVVRGEGTLGRRGFAWLLAGVCVLNLAFQANSSWLHHSAALKRTIRTLGDAEAIFPHYVPERTLIGRLPRGDDGIVLATEPGRAYIAELGLRGRSVLDHDPELSAARMRAEADPSGQQWRGLLQASGARWALVVPASASPPLHKGLALAGAQRVDAVGDAELWRIGAEAIGTEASTR
ncbi:hypothetical protein [Marilutibacter alkalisoli]|uniref:Glycosyltransferase RgtA/B/C/D-like domain-containing protein n=1 Tax=Marilutibacter alkalisoli TaxID=2591633 RepID=A0A514BNC4_9GAMM|nr:hypothetical protein [Lysobacter alkalisoli]QDH68881.1 hypothetical protein FKV23_01260 [Lysobacter alkalisoli]